MSLFKSTATGNVAIAKTVTPSQAAALDSIILHLSAAGGAGNLTVTLDAAAGAAYDTVLLTQDMTLVTDLLWQPDRPIELDNGDSVVVAWANAAGRTYGLTVNHLGR
jgi:microcystin degradation protein MlrC